MNEVRLVPLGRVSSPYKTKFGTPRQSGLIRNDNTRIILDEQFDRDFFRGAKVGHFFWINFHFHLCEGKFKGQVRPPKLGGNKKVGVFATRSPFRPNNLGLSLGRLCSIESASNIILTFQGLDLVDGTPILDIRPYHPLNDVPWEKSNYWFLDSNRAEAELTKEVEEFTKKDGINETRQVRLDCERPDKMNDNELHFIENVLLLDPRPAYHNDERTYCVKLIDYEIFFVVKSKDIIITKIQLQ